MKNWDEWDSASCRVWNHSSGAVPTADGFSLAAGRWTQGKDTTFEPLAATRGGA